MLLIREIGKMRIMTDFAAERYWTIVSEFEVENLDAFEKIRVRPGPLLQFRVPGMQVGVDLEPMRHRQDDVVVVQVARDHTTDRLLVIDDRRRRGSGCIP